MDVILKQAGTESTVRSGVAKFGVMEVEDIGAGMDSQAHIPVVTLSTNCCPAMQSISGQE